MLSRSRCLTATTRQAFRWHRTWRERPNFINNRQCYSTSTEDAPTKSHITLPNVLSRFKESLDFPPATCKFSDLAENGSQWIDNRIVLHGYLGARRVANKKLTFAELRGIDLGSNTLQTVSISTGSSEDINSVHQLIQNLGTHTPVAIEGTIKSRKLPKPKSSNDTSSDSKSTLDPLAGIELHIERVIPLNPFTSDIIMQCDTNFPPEQRHLQIRNDTKLREALAFRSKVARFLRRHLHEQYGFEEIETPLLFKSTPEGAREFLVPTRNPGMAYALPQSPQQYKQILMGSGIPRYMQIAKCFRDEDLRADRQPEFTQVDLEMAFATGEDVMNVIEPTIKALWSETLGITDLPASFPRLTYDEAMSKYGSDKPDVRLGPEIKRIDYMLPVDLVSKIGPHSDPIVEVLKIPISDSAQKTRQFVETFMSSPEAQPFIQNPDGQPGISIIDTRKPLSGLQVFGFEAAEQVEEMLELQDGDLVVYQARPNAPFAGAGSTPLGNLRLALHKAAVAQHYLPAPTVFAFLWITSFPLFTPSTASEPGQGGSSGLSATHHPFTSPATSQDVDILATDPSAAKADHYDLVLNGVELGGGSRRIHSAEMQLYVLRDVLGMSDARVADFAHLLDVLRAGCPPHAGMALGFDRLVAVMLGRESVRDVIAFPKSGRGEDLLVKSPTRMTEGQLETYALRLGEGV